MTSNTVVYIWSALQRRNWWPLAQVFAQAKSYHPVYFSGVPCWKGFHLWLSHPLSRYKLRVCLKWTFKGDKLIKQAPKRPDISFRGEDPWGDLLRRLVLRGGQKSFSKFLSRIQTFDKIEITQFDVVIFIQEYTLWPNIAMNDHSSLIVMDLIHSQHNLREYFPDGLLLQLWPIHPFELQKLMETASRTILHHNVYIHVFLIEEIGVVSNNIVTLNIE